MKKKLSQVIADDYTIVLSVYIGVFFAIHEFFDLGWSPTGTLGLTAILALVFILWQRKSYIVDYILLLVIIGDGYFHLTSPLDNLVKNSPDWVIAFNLFGGNGMPLIVHQTMGVFLLSTSALFIYLLAKRRKNWQYYLYKYGVGIITLSIISLSYVIKLYK